MCTYTTHVRVCGACRREDTVLISEQLCLAARASGIFGSCLEGILSQRDATGHQCWQCKERKMRQVGAPAAMVVGGGLSLGGASRARRMRRPALRGGVDSIYYGGVL